MNTLRSIVLRLRNLFRKNQLDRELQDELATHLELHIADNLRSGMTPEEARRQALLKLGGLEQTKESVRDQRTFPFLETFFQDARFALRMLRKNPAFTAIAILTLALGIGATTTIFTVANDFLLRSLPFSNADRIVMVKRYDSKLAQSGWADPPTFKYWQAQNHVFKEMAAWSEITNQFNLTGPEGPERVSAKQVSSNFFQVLGVNPILGRTFSDAEDRPGGNPVAIIGHSLWITRFGGNAGILGKTITLDGKDYSVIGVLPAAFRFSTTPEDVWTPLAALVDGGEGGFYLNVIASLRPGVTLSQAQADMDVVTRPWAAHFPDFWSSDQRVAVESLRDRYSLDLRPALLTLFVAASLVLLIACLNLANLLLVLATSRYKEIAVRRALGAGRARMIRQMLSESSVLALLGGFGGLLIAFASVRAFYAALPPSWQPISRGGMDGAVFAFVLVTMLLTLFLIGMVPAWSATGFDLTKALKEGLQSPLASMDSPSFRAVLVIGEVALAAMLLTGAALVIKSFVRLSAVNLGFNSENVLTLNVARTKAGADTLYKDVLERLSALPTVNAVGAINFRPLVGSGWSQDIIIEGRPPLPRGDLIWAAHRDVSLGYFRAMSIPLLLGRSFDATDQDKSVAVISDSMAKSDWPGENPIGKRFGVNCAGTPCHWNSVVGVVGDVRELGATADPSNAMYFLGTMSEMTLVVRSAGSPTHLIADVRGIIASLDPNQPIADIRSMESIVSESVAPRRLTMLIASLFAALALLLAIIGLYGVISYSVAQRSHELGVRLALGATKEDILHLIVTQGFGLAFVGIILGMSGALALTRVLARLLFGITPTDPLTFGAVTLLLVGVSLFACYIPARRATHVDPIQALRYE